MSAESIISVTQGHRPPRLSARWRQPPLAHTTRHRPLCPSGHSINIERDPRWGRACEVASEDPLINGDFGSQYSQGVQQAGLDANFSTKFLSGVATLKHWDAYSLEDSDGSRRYDFNAIVSPYALQTTYFPAFSKSVLEGGALGVMCAWGAWPVLVSPGAPAALTPPSPLSLPRARAQAPTTP